MIKPYNAGSTLGACIEGIGDVLEQNTLPPTLKMIGKILILVHAAANTLPVIIWGLHYQVIASKNKIICI